MRNRIKKQIWLSEEDNAELKRKAAQTGLTETAVFRLLLRSYEPKEKPDGRFYDAMRELSAIGNNINQLAAKANTLGFIDARCCGGRRSAGTDFRRTSRPSICAPAQAS